LYALRIQRPKVVTATQASHEAMFSPDVDGLPLGERLLVALYACRLSKADSLAAYYRERLLVEGVDVSWMAAIDLEKTPWPVDARLQEILAFTGQMIERSIEASRSGVDALRDVGLSTPAIVALGQLVAFLSYQIRLVAGLQAMQAAGVGGVEHE